MELEAPPDPAIILTQEEFDAADGIAPTLDEWAIGLNQVNRDIQRQAAAFNHFKGVCNLLHRISRGEKLEISERLPFVTFTFPTDEKQPGEYKLDLNTLSPVTLIAMQEQFVHIASDVGMNLLHAWQLLFEVVNKARPLVDAAIEEVTEPPQQAGSA